MLIGVPAETTSGEKRVATVPDVVQKLVKLGFSVAVQSGAGEAVNIMVMTISASSSAIASYQRAGSTVDVWLASGTPNLTNGALNATIYGHAVIN